MAANDPSVAFIVSLAGAAIKGDSLMLRQVELISKSQGMPDALWQGTKPSLRNRYAILQQADKTTDELQKELYADVTKTMSSEQLKDLNTVQQISAQIRSMTSPWYLHFMRYDPANALKNVKCPVLALNGEKDIQVDATMNLTAIQQRISENGNKNVTVKAYPNLLVGVLGVIIADGSHCYPDFSHGFAPFYSVRLVDNFRHAERRLRRKWILLGSCPL